MELHALPDDFALSALGANQYALNALPDDFTLLADADTERSPGTVLTFVYYLTDTLGNILTDPSGNRLIGMVTGTVYPQILHALPDDFGLNAE